jgi:hypothetical protein
MRPLGNCSSGGFEPVTARPRGFSSDTASPSKNLENIQASEIFGKIVMGHLGDDAEAAE